MTLGEKAIGTISIPQQRYVETIRDLAAEKGLVHVSDIARRMGVRLPSVTEAVHRLSAAGLVRRGPHHTVELTESGAELASQLECHHQMFRGFLVNVLGLDPAEGDRIACEFEHLANCQVVSRLARIAEWFQRAPAHVVQDLAAYVRRDGGADSFFPHAGAGI